MEGTLERYQRYSFEERAVLDPTIEDQVLLGNIYYNDQKTIVTAT